VGDRRGVAPLGPLLRLLAAPGEPLSDDRADVLDVVGDAEVAADHLGDPLGAPEVVVPALGLGPLQEQPFESLDRLVTAARLGAGMGLGGEGLGGLAIELQPGGEGGSSDAEDAGDEGGLLALLDQFDGSAASAFEFFGGSSGSQILNYDRRANLFGWLRWTQ